MAPHPAVEPPMHYAVLMHVHTSGQTHALVTRLVYPLVALSVSAFPTSIPLRNVNLRVHTNHSNATNIGFRWHWNSYVSRGGPHNSHSNCRALGASSHLIG